MGFGSYEEGDQDTGQNEEDEVDEEEVLEINKQRSEGEETTELGDKDVSELLDAF